MQPGPLQEEGGPGRVQSVPSRVRKGEVTERSADRAVKGEARAGERKG